MTLRIGTRGSPLALWQARATARALAEAGHESTLVIIRTSGDKLQEAPLETTGSKHLFVKEIEDALLSHDIDLAVHSTKDLPADLPPGLTIAAFLPRADPRDAIVLPLTGGAGPAVSDVVSGLSQVRGGAGPLIGTSSLRRTGQLAHHWPHARFAAVRGNVETRLRKLDDGDCEALVLACAGLDRLGLGGRISLRLPIDFCVPAPGQGAVAIEIREDDAPLAAILSGITDRAAAEAVAIERMVVTALGGGCQTPMGVHAVLTGDEVELHVAIASIDGREVLRRDARGPRADGPGLAERVSAELTAAGAARLLDPGGQEKG